MVEQKEKEKLPQTYGMGQLLALKYDKFDLQGEWFDIFGKPERGVTWFLWGASGSGKSTVCSRLVKMFLEINQRVLYLSLEEKRGESITRKLEDAGVTAKDRNFKLLASATLQELILRLRKRNSPDVIFVDSLQYIKMSYDEYKKLHELFPSKTFIIISHATGANPKGAAGEGVHYDAGVKIWVEGGIIEAKHRFEGGGGKKVIIPSLAEKFKLGRSEEMKEEQLAIYWQFLREHDLLAEFGRYVEQFDYKLGMFRGKRRRRK